jgi:hypothetical protein
MAPGALFSAETRVLPVYKQKLFGGYCKSGWRKPISFAK